MLRNLQNLILLSTLAPAFTTFAVPLTCETHNTSSIAILPSMAVANYYIPEYTFRDEKNQALSHLQSPRYVLKNRLEGKIFFASLSDKNLQLFASDMNLAERNTPAYKIANLSAVSAETRNLFEQTLTKVAPYFISGTSLYLKTENSTWEKRDLTDLKTQSPLPAAIKNADLVSPLENSQFAITKTIESHPRLFIYSLVNESLNAIPQQLAQSSQFNLQSSGNLLLWGEWTQNNFIRSYTYFVATADLKKVRKLYSQNDQELSSAPLLVKTSKGDHQILFVSEKFEQLTSGLFSFRGLSSGALTSFQLDPVTLKTSNEHKIPYDSEMVDKINSIKVSINHGLTAPVWIREDDQIIFSSGKIGGTISYSFQKSAWNYHGVLGTNLTCEYPERNQ